MSFSASRGFNAATVFGWIRSEVAENYRPARYGLVFDPWFGADPGYASAWAGAPVAVNW